MKLLIAGGPSPNYKNAAALVGLEVIDTLTPTEAELNACSGLLLPGGNDVDPAYYGQKDTACRLVCRETDEAQFQILQYFVSAEKPVLGICRGHQVINVFFGGTLIQHLEQTPAHGWDNGDQVHMVSTEPDCVLAELYGTRFAVNSAHHQGIGRLADGFNILQRSDDGVIEAVQHKEKPILGVQWHPERMSGQLRREDTVDGLPMFLWLKEQMAAYKG